MRPGAQLAGGVLLMLLLSACSVISPRPQAPQRSAASVEDFSLRATLLARGEQRARASLHWVQEQGVFDLRVAGTFGIGATRFVGDAHKVEVSRGEERWVSWDPAADFAAITGMPVPLQALPDWVRGLPSATQPPAQRWEAEGWTVEVLQRQLTAGVLLPSSLLLSRPGQSLAIEDMRWEFGP